MTCKNVCHRSKYFVDIKLRQYYLSWFSFYDPYSCVVFLNLLTYIDVSTLNKSPKTVSKNLALEAVHFVFVVASEKVSTLIKYVCVLCLVN